MQQVVHQLCKADDGNADAHKQRKQKTNMHVCQGTSQVEIQYFFDPGGVYRFKSQKQFLIDSGNQSNGSAGNPGYYIR